MTDIVLGISEIIGNPFKDSKGGLKHINKKDGIPTEEDMTPSPIKTKIYMKNLVTGELNDYQPG